MTQPSGRVLSFPSRYRAYLRSVPIICALDALGFLLRVFLTPYLLPVSLREALELTIGERYKDNLDENESIRSLEKQTWLRWVFFVVGTLGPSIKLMAMRGVPWTKTWGVMFLFAFLVSEASALSHRRTIGVMSYLPGIASALETAKLRVARQFETLERWTFYVGIACHSAILFWTFFDLWAPSVPAPEPVKDSSIYGELPFAAWEFAWFLTGIMVVIGPFILLLGIYSAFSDFWSSFRAGRLGNRRSYLGAFIVGILMLASEAGLCWLVIAIWNKDWVLFTLSLGIVPTFVFAVKKLCGYSPKLGEFLMIVEDEDHDESAQPVDGIAVSALTLCITTLTICVLWYWLRYNPEGTVNPSLAGIFG